MTLGAAQTRGKQARAAAEELGTGGPTDPRTNCDTILKIAATTPLRKDVKAASGISTSTAEAVVATALKAKWQARKKAA
jgi:hypothetical protein